MSSPRHMLPLADHEKYRETIRDTLDGNLVLPHSIEAGDPYYIGDVYDTTPAECVQEWELCDNIKRPYLDHIKAVSHAWPHLRYLAHWMEVTTSPVKWNHIKAKQAVIRKERASRTNVAVVDFAPGAAPAIHTATSPDALCDSLRSAPVQPDVHRMYVVEDLSRDVVEALGAALDIDPLFFRGQISDYWWYNTRDPWVELPDLQVVSRRRRFFHVGYLQPRHFGSQASFAEATKEAARFNVLRRADNDKNHKTLLDQQGALVALVRSKASFWWKPAEGDRGAVGVLLVDPSVKEGSPLWAGYRNFEPTPSISARGPFKAPPRTSLFEAVVYWVTRMEGAEVAQMGADPRIMLRGLSQIICAEWLTVIRYITTRLGQVEWELENPDFRRDPSGINSSLAKLHPWRRSVPLYKTLIKEATAKVFNSSNGPLSEYTLSLKEDFRVVEEGIDTLLQRIERIVAVATAIISIEESRRGYSLNQDLGRLTYLAVVFAPLSFVTGFFSMSEDVSSLRGTYWIYFCVALPVTVLAFVLVDMARVKRWARRWSSR
ncbi:hypothetical protein BN1708_004910 [Verticillium longisporum]|uniref:Uncharacterized protein n=1 Tax=Verticillium longisporum TaxID=100787 RepID=A0A0G4M4M3_VERLO|nr:hypothetical protein BN1708_004910 [Verticillium longisporum]